MIKPFGPEWEGYITQEFFNITPLPAQIHASEGCTQVLFFESDEVCETLYKDRGGKYQDQTGVTHYRRFEGFSTTLNRRKCNASDSSKNLWRFVQKLLFQAVCIWVDISCPDNLRIQET
jgi:hypothetical protein